MGSRFLVSPSKWGAIHPRSRAQICSLVEAGPIVWQVPANSGRKRTREGGRDASRACVIPPRPHRARPEAGTVEPVTVRQSTPARGHDRRTWLTRQRRVISTGLGSNRDSTSSIGREILSKVLIIRALAPAVRGFTLGLAFTLGGGAEVSSGSSSMNQMDGGRFLGSHGGALSEIHVSCHVWEQQVWMPRRLA